MIDLLTDMLACHRITRLIVTDSIFDRPRAHLKQSLHAAGYEKALEGLRCNWCVSVYVGFGVVVARRAFPRAWPAVAEALACSTVAGVVSTFV